MPMKRYKPEQIVNLLRQIEIEIANGKTTPQACRKGLGDRSENGRGENCRTWPLMLEAWCLFGVGFI